MEFFGRLSEDARTLAEVLRQHGYFTVAFIANGFAQSCFGLDRGFDMSFEYPSRYPSEPHYMNAGEVTDDVVAWLEQNSGLNYFMCVFVVDPHKPYVPPPSYCREFECNSPIEKYDGEIRFVDGQFGRLIDALKRSNAYGRTNIVFTSDHGEEFGEHGGRYHGSTLYEEVIRVPLIVSGHSATRGRTTDLPVELIDVAPTILDLLGVPRPPGWQGRSLAPLAFGTPDRVKEKPLFFHLNRSVNRTNGPQQGKTVTGTVTRSIYAVRKGDMKLIETTDGDDSPKWELYDLRKDPGEKNPSVIAHPIWFYRMRADLHDLKKMAGREAVSSKIVTETVSKEDIERLKAIGYLQ